MNSQIHDAIWLKMKPYENVRNDAYEVSSEGDVLDIENQNLVETYTASTGCLCYVENTTRRL